MKTRHTACTPTELKQNLLHLFSLLRFSLVLLLNMSLDEHSLLLSQVKAVVCNDNGGVNEKDYANASFQEDYK